MLGRRCFVAGLALTSCTKCEPKRELVEAPAKPLPQMPAPDASLGRRGQVGTQTFTFGTDERAVVIAPTWTKEKLPVLIALHGRGEAQKGPELGALGWPNDYLLLRAIERICAPPLTRADFEGLVENDRLASMNEGLAKRPFHGLIVVCPFLPDFDLQKPKPLEAYGQYLISKVLPRVRKELPALDTTGIDGVSLGGAAALRIGLANPDIFTAVGSLQAAISSDQVPELVELAKKARPKSFRLITSHQDYFRKAITLYSQSLKAAGIPHEYADLPGPHDYPFNRGPGALEMLDWHDRVLST